MPITDRVAKQYASKGVVLYAVNQKEDAKTVRAFLTKNKLKVNVLLDSNNVVGGKYGVKAIPTLVLIDKDGTVQKVHVGFSNSLERTLKRDLDALLAGKKLATNGGQTRRGGGAGGQGGFPGGAGGQGGFPGASGRKKPQPKPGTPEHTADDFVAKMIAGDTKAAAAMVSPRARTPALKELLNGSLSKQSSDQWKLVLQGAQRNGVARSIRADRVVTLTNSRRQTVRIVLRRQGKDYKIYSIAVGSSTTKRRRRR